MNNIPQLPVSSWIDKFVDWLASFEGFFNAVTNFIGGIINGFQWIFDLLPIWLFMLLVVGCTYWLNRKTKHWTLIGFEIVGLLYIWDQGFWRDMHQTLTLVLN